LPQNGGTGAYHSPAFVSTWANGLMGASPAFQNTLNAAYTETVVTKDGLPYYFGNTLRAIALFQMTGNFWNPTHSITKIQKHVPSSTQTIVCFPNPMQQTSTLLFEQVQRNTQIRIINSSGQILRKMCVNGQKIYLDRKELQAGVYTIFIFDGHRQRSIKMILL
jgi:hypothetical protein